MTLWLLPIAPLVTGVLVWLAGDRVRGETARRLAVGAISIAGLMGALAVAVWAVAVQPAASHPWGAGLSLSISVQGPVRIAAPLVIAVALAVVLWASAHEDLEGLPRLVGLLTAFAGAMELLVLAADFLSLAFAWELVGGLSWALIAHHHRDRGATGSAAYALNASRIGGVGLWIAAAAGLATAGSFEFAALPAVMDTPWAHAVTIGVLLAAASKSAQGPFAPWLFRAMDGPSSASALLHSSTMVAAGAWLLIRLHEPLASVSWFGPAAIAIGLSTALAGGLVACLQPHAKRLLAASTSAQYGLMFAAVGAGSAGAALWHLVAHAALKALLFLAAGVAIGAAGGPLLRDMRLGRKLPAVAAASAIGALALAAIPPLGAAWTKEQVVAATGHRAPWLAGVTILAGALSAFYALRFQTLGFGRHHGGEGRAHEVGAAESVALWILAAASLALGLLWLPAVQHFASSVVPGLSLPDGKTWELLTSTASVLAAAVLSWWMARRRAAPWGAEPSRVRGFAADWLGLPALIRASVITPVLALARVAARFDDRVIDGAVASAATASLGLSRALTNAVEAGVDRAVSAVAATAVSLAGFSRRGDDDGVDYTVRALASRVGIVGREVRKLQTGAIPTYYAYVAAGVVILLAILSLWSAA